MMSNFIDPSNGSLLINPKICITRTSRPENIVSHFGPNQALFTDLGNGWSWFRVDKVASDSEFYGLLFVFRGHSLRQVNFLLGTAPEHTSWKDWSEQNERAIQKKMEEKLTERLGTQRIYPWGDIGSFYDGKGCSSSIVLRYNESFNA